MKAVSIIRDRGQLTIPEAIRKEISWISPMCAIVLSIVGPNEIVIHPHRVKVDAKRIWSLVKQSRSIKSKATESAADFLQHDRKSH